MERESGKSEGSEYMYAHNNCTCGTTKIKKCFTE